MNRRDILLSGIAAGATMMAGNELLAQVGETSGSGRNMVGRALFSDQIDSVVYVEESSITRERSGELEILTMDLGRKSHGSHLAEFNVARGTKLILGQVQERAHFGDALVRTYGIAIREESTGDWRCRIDFGIIWGPSDSISIKGRFVLLS